MLCSLEHSRVWRMEARKGNSNLGINQYKLQLLDLVSYTLSSISTISC